MCGLFGLVDYNKVFTRKQREKIIRVLSIESQQRGTDATGVAYLCNDAISICKRPLQASKINFHFPSESNVIMGHTRMTTQGNEKQNCNNHPFKGICGHDTFALSHNGAIHNDWVLRKSLKLPKTDIETDSYIAVQLLERQNALNFTTLKEMAETVEGSFCFTVLDNRGRLFFIKGENPIAIFRFEEGFYIYASTGEILKRAITKLGLYRRHHETINLRNGDMICIEPDGSLEKETFENFSWNYYHFSRPFSYGFETDFDESYVALLKDVAGCFGYSPEDIDCLLEDGFTPEEIEEYFYSECVIKHSL